MAGAIGDALGYPIEFMQAEEIGRRFGIDAPGQLAYAGEPPALVSDDTQMTLFVAEGIIRAAQRMATKGICNPASVGYAALMRWYATQTGTPLESDEVGWLARDRRLHARRAPGTTIMHALGAYAGHGRPDELVARNDSKGCGTVMRAAPFGFLPSREVAFEAAEEDARITHGHPTAALASGAMASLVWDLSRGASVDDALENAGEILASRRDAAEPIAAIARARAVAARRPLNLGPLGSGWVAEEALAFAVACALAFEPDEPRAVERTLWRAAYHDGDSDSTASITGNLLGAMIGSESLPRAWMAQVELRNTVERIGRDLHAALFEGALFSFDDYPPV